MADYKDKLAAILNSAQTSPFLFVGSGLSRRYLGLPSWEGLLKHFCDYANISGKPYGYYYSLAGGNEHFPQLATLLAQDFHSIWWNEDRFKDNVNLHPDDIFGLSSPLKIEVAEYIFDNSRTIDADYENEIEELRKINIDGIITTNWDNFLETIFDYRVYIGQEDLIFQPTQSIAEIYKIHGCCSQPNSLVLTQEDYKDFGDKNAYLAAKLLTIFIEHPVIFLGYSLSDENIRNILSAIFSCMNKDQIEHLQNRLIFVRRPKDTEEEGFVSAFIYGHNGKNIPVTEIRTNDYSGVYKVLQQKKRKIPAKLLRSFKDELYKIILTQDPTNRLLAARISDEMDPANLEFVAGLGLIDEFSVLGYGNFPRETVCEDVIFGTKKLVSQAMVLKNLPTIAVKPAYVPIFKYLRDYGVINDDGIIADVNIPEKLIKYAKSRLKYNLYTSEQKKKRDGFLKKYDSLKSVTDACDIQEQLYILPLLPYQQDDLEELRKYLADNFHFLSDTKLKTSFCKLISVYDLLKYGPKAFNVEPPKIV